MTAVNYYFFLNTATSIKTNEFILNLPIFLYADEFVLKNKSLNLTEKRGSIQLQSHKCQKANLKLTQNLSSMKKKASTKYRRKKLTCSLHQKTVLNSGAHPIIVATHISL